MKKHFLTLAAVALTAGTLFFTGCSKDDVTAPVVTLVGGDQTIIVGVGTYTELGATASDDKDGTITPTWTGTVDTKIVGVYTVTYSATDAAGNVGEATRTVTVRNEADVYAGEYTCTNPDFGKLSPWDQTVKVSPSKNNVLIFSKFAARSGNTTIEATVVNVSAGVVQLKISDATVTPTSGGCTFKYSANGNGANITKISGKYTFSVKYYEEQVAGGGSCTAIPATPFEDKFDQK
ncbi:MAG TPA: DUF5011 domain-containing protein [Bacteroidia bacterium]|nr:DUF5011 domain-containing protein [Bacteroidia bacterium]